MGPNFLARLTSVVPSSMEGQAFWTVGFQTMLALLVPSLLKRLTLMKSIFWAGLILVRLSFLARFFFVEPSFMERQTLIGPNASVMPHLTRPHSLERLLFLT